MASVELGVGETSLCVHDAAPESTSVFLCLRTDVENDECVLDTCLERSPQ
jgi:hypothetical protein